MSTVLVLDDRQDDRELMATLLSHAGHDVVQSESGETALDVARARHPDLIISDILMPGMNGYEFVRRLRLDAGVGSTPVIFCTANYLEGEVRGLASRCGVSRFISKPCPPELVLAVVEEALAESPPQLLAAALDHEFESEQLRVINDKLVEKVEQLEQLNAQRQQLLGLVFRARDDERMRIADGIHDECVQSLAAIGLRLESLREEIRTEAGLHGLDEARRAAAATGERLRSLLFELRPPQLDSAGLVNAMTVYLNEVRSQEGLSFELNDRLEREPEPEVRLFIFRAVQELVMNIRKHARARSLNVSLSTRGSRIEVTVADDGIGFEPAGALRARPGHLGLAALDERLRLAGGRLRVQSAPNAGSWIQFELPSGALTD